MQGPLALKNKMLSTPLLSISKASTPISTRIVFNNVPLNSTPISQLKYGSTSSLNKQNKQNTNTNNLSLYESNLIQSKERKMANLEGNNSKRPLNSNTFSQAINFGDCKLKGQSKFQGQLAQSGGNLSPIMALNRKMKEGPLRTQSFRSLTPNYSKRDESLFQASCQRNQQNTLKSTSMILEEKPINTASGTAGPFLRASNSFSNLFEKRERTPTRLGSMAFSSLSRKKHHSPLNNNQKQSAYNKLATLSNTMANNISLKQSKFCQGQFSSNPEGSLQCQNNHNKIAKYRIVSTQEEQGHAVYCSKCAIDLVQKGFSVEEIHSDVESQLTNITSLHGSPRQPNFSELRHSKSFHNKFLNFKTSYSSLLLQKLKVGQRIKSHIIQLISGLQTKKSIIQKRFFNEDEQVDCYYNSLISYIEQQRSKDKANLSNLKQNLMLRLFQAQSSTDINQSKLCSHLQKIQNFLKTRSINPVISRQLQQIQSQLNQLYYNLHNQAQKDTQLTGFLQNPQKRLIYFENSIQEQFDEFVSYLDQKGSLQYSCYDQIAKLNNVKTDRQIYINQQTNTNNKKTLGKNNALRFSFQKALQNQTKKNNFVQTQMDPLQQQEQEYDENSFNQENNCIAECQEDVQQRPFRTLFAEEDDIILQDEVDEGKGKNGMYSPTFKAI